MNDLLLIVGSSAFAVSAVAWLIRSLVVHLLNKDAEKHLEILRYQLSHASQGREKRAAAIAEIHEKLIDLIDAVIEFVKPMRSSGEQSIDDAQEKFGIASTAFKKCFAKKKIFLSEDLADKIDAFVKDFVDPAIEFAIQRHVAAVSQDPLGRSTQSDIANWGAAWDKVSKDLPITRREIEREFRQVLGIDAIVERD